jgi:hypothetical protein
MTMSSEIYKYSSSNWIIETQYNQLDLLKGFLNSNQGVHNNKGLSTSGNADQHWFLGRGADYSKNKPFIKIHKSISKLISKELNDHFLLDTDVFLKPMSSWEVTGTKGGFHKIHDHQGNYGICIVIYTQVPETINDENSEGHVYFVLSADMGSNLYSSDTKVVNIKPELGKMIIFPSHMLHGVYPYPEGNRQSFNMDFIVRPLDQIQNETLLNYD